MDLQIEVDKDSGSFRFVLDGKPDRWYPYTSVGTFNFWDRHFFAVSPYYAGTFPVYTVLEWKEKEVGTI